MPLPTYTPRRSGCDRAASGRCRCMACSAAAMRILRKDIACGVAGALIDAEGRWVKILDLRRDLHLVIRGIEARDRADAGHAVYEILKERFCGNFAHRAEMTPMPVMTTRCMLVHLNMLQCRRRS